MKKSTQTVLYKGQAKTLTVVFHETKEEYAAAYEAADVPEVWYEKYLGVKARAFTANGMIQTSVASCGSQTQRSPRPT